MTAIGQNFEVFQGDYKEIEILVKDENNNNLPLDLAPYVAFNGIVWVVYRKTTKAIVLSKTLSAGISVPAPITGIIKITLNPADTELLEPNVYNHECEISSSPTNVATVTTGNLTILYSRA